MQLCVLEALQNVGVPQRLVCDGVLPDPLHTQQTGKLHLAFDGWGTAYADGSIHVQGCVQARVPLFCARCGCDFEQVLSIQTDDVFVLAPAGTQRYTLADDRHVYNGGNIDLVPMCGEWIVLTLPMAPLCAADAADETAEAVAQAADVD